MRARVCGLLLVLFGRPNNDSLPRIASPTLCCCVRLLFTHSLTPPRPASYNPLWILDLSSSRPTLPLVARSFQNVSTRARAHVCVREIFCECFGRPNNDSSPRIAPPALCCFFLVLFPHSSRLAHLPTLLSRFTICLFIPSHDAARRSLVSVCK